MAATMVLVYHVIQHVLPAQMELRVDAPHVRQLSFYIRQLVFHSVLTVIGALFRFRIVTLVMMDVLLARTTMDALLVFQGS